jgi:hypothetical protein
MWCCRALQQFVVRESDESFEMLTAAVVQFMIFYFLALHSLWVDTAVSEEHSASIFIVLGNAAGMILRKTLL